MLNLIFLLACSRLKFLPGKPAESTSETQWQQMPEQLHWSDIDRVELYRRDDYSKRYSLIWWKWRKLVSQNSSAIGVQYRCDLVTFILKLSLSSRDMQWGHCHILERISLIRIEKFQYRTKLICSQHFLKPWQHKCPAFLAFLFSLNINLMTSITVIKYVLVIDIFNQ